MHDVKQHEHKHGDVGILKRLIEEEAAAFKDFKHEAEAIITHKEAPAVKGEHVHHHVHEVIQPVVQKETVVPTVVHTTIVSTTTSSVYLQASMLTHSSLSMRSITTKRSTTPQLRCLQFQWPNSRNKAEFSLAGL